MDISSAFEKGISDFLKGAKRRTMKEQTIKIYLQPRASRNEIVGTYRDGLKVKVQAPPTEEKANAELLRFLAKEWHIPLSRIEIIRGRHSREKILRISTT